MCLSIPLLIEALSFSQSSFVVKFFLLFLFLYVLTGQNNRFPFLDILPVFKEYPQKCQIWKSETSTNHAGNLVGKSLVGTCLTLPNLGFLWVFFKYPKISKNGDLLFFPVFYHWYYLRFYFLSLFTAADYLNMMVSNVKALATLDTVHEWT